MKLTTTVYKYKRFAPLMVVLMVIGTVLMFFLSEWFHPVMNVIAIVLLVFIAIYGALRPKSIFSLRAVDERKLIFSADELTWGNLCLPIHELEKLELYIHAFDSFRHVGVVTKRSKLSVSEYGDKNTISFYYRGVRHDMTFFLGTFTHYDTLVGIMQCWKNKGVDFSARSAFTDTYIREQVNLLGG